MSNKAAIITGSLEPENLIKVQEIPYPKASKDEIVIKTIAYAINPTDWKHIYFNVSKEGNIAGTDASGIVESVGSNVNGFAKGDYVGTFIHGNVSPENGAFQRYLVGDPQTTFKIPGDITTKSLTPGDYDPDTVKSFEGAAALPLGLSTVGLSFSTTLEISPDKSGNKSKTILIWGGSTATGILAIQIAKSIYGLNVVTTASKKNHGFLKSIGADIVFDYNDEASLTKLSEYDYNYALDSVSSLKTFQQTYDATENSRDVKLDNLFFLQESQLKTDPSRSGKIHILPGTLSYAAVGYKIVAFGIEKILTSEENEKYKHFWFDLLPKHLPFFKVAGLKVLAPGLSSANEGMILNKEGKVSAQKIVFRYD